MSSHLATPRILYHDRALPAERRRKGLAIAVLVVLAFLLPSAAVLGRDAIAKALPQTEAIYAALGLPTGASLEIGNVSSVLRQENNQTVLEISGRIENSGRLDQRVAGLRIAILGADGRELYHWTAAPPKEKLQAGESISFRTRLEDPPAAAASVKVRFARPGDESWSPPVR